MNCHNSMSGFEVCECKKFAFIYLLDILRLLPREYHGELCTQCGLWVCNIRYLKIRGKDEKNKNN